MRIAITGANRGIGLELTKKFLVEGHTVIALCRAPSSSLEQTEAIIVSGFDVTSPEMLNIIKQKFENNPIDILVNNAGIMRSEDFQSFTKENIMKQVEVNAIAPLLIAREFTPFINKNGKIAMITSRMGSIADNDSGGQYGYRMSKAALNAGSKSLALDLKPKNIAIGVFHPGFVQTDMTGGTGEITPVECAARLHQRITELNLESSGKFYHSNGEELPW